MAAYSLCLSHVRVSQRSLPGVRIFDKHFKPELPAGCEKSGRRRIKRFGLSRREGDYGRSGQRLFRRSMGRPRVAKVGYLEQENPNLDPAYRGARNVIAGCVKRKKNILDR